MRASVCGGPGLIVPTRPAYLAREYAAGIEPWAGQREQDSIGALRGLRYGGDDREHPHRPWRRPLGRAPDPVLGVALFGAAYLGFATGSASILPLGLCFVAAGLGIGRVEAAEHAAVAVLAPAALRSSSFGLPASVRAFGDLAASAGTGLLWTWWSPHASFLYLQAWVFPARGGFLGLSRHAGAGGQ